MKGLRDSVALVTGATGLLGSAIALRLADEGAKVAVASRNLQKAKDWIEGHGRNYTGRLVPLELDLANERSINSAFDRLIRAVGTPTILIANASLRDNVAVPISELTHADFTRLFEVDVAGHFLCARNLVKHLSAGTKASITFISSVYAIVGVDHSIYPHAMKPTPGHYAAVKSGILGMTRYLAAEWGKIDVRVNVVLAGGIQSPQRQSGEFVRNYNRKTMLNRMATPDEIAGSVVFLASEEASYITGAYLVVDGGFSAW